VVEEAQELIKQLLLPVILEVAEEEVHGALFRLEMETRLQQPLHKDLEEELAVQKRRHILEVVAAVPQNLDMRALPLHQMEEKEVLVIPQISPVLLSFMVVEVVAAQRGPTEHQEVTAVVEVVPLLVVELGL
jgi:hypothetical protein